MSLTIPFYIPPIPEHLLIPTDEKSISQAVSKSELYKDIAGIVAGYAIDNIPRFGAREWLKRYEVDVLCGNEEPELPPEFYDFWYGPDPIDPTKKVYDTHFYPVLRPHLVRRISTNELYPYSFETLRALINNPKEGHSANFAFERDAFDQIRNRETAVSCWLVMRKNLLARHKSLPDRLQVIKDLNANTDANYEELPSAIDLATVALTHHVATGQRILGDWWGLERRLTWSQCREQIEYPHGTFPLYMGDFGNEGLKIVSLGKDQNDGHWLGVAAVAKF